MFNLGPPEKYVDSGIEDIRKTMDLLEMAWEVGELDKTMAYSNRLAMYSSFLQQSAVPEPDFVDQKTQSAYTSPNSRE